MEIWHRRNGSWFPPWFEPGAFTPIKLELIESVLSPGAEASTVFGDALAATIVDPRYSEFEVRCVTMGISSEGRLLIVAHADDDEGIRIISARAATAHERRRYESGT